jgi:transcriptional regulator with XRE-family HTH domain
MMAYLVGKSPALISWPNQLILEQQRFRAVAELHAQELGRCRSCGRMKSACDEIRCREQSHEQESAEPGKCAVRLGAILRTTRQARSMTIREVAEQTRISAAYLTMLEIGDYSAIADELYLLPFLRSYANFLGLDAGALSARFIGAIGDVGKVVDRPSELLLEYQESPTERSGWVSTVMLIVFIALSFYLVRLSTGAP